MLSSPSTAAAAAGVWSATPADSSSSKSNSSSSSCVRVHLTKLPSERSFGLTLEQRVGAAVVSYVFPGSPAARVGVQRGWRLLRLNRRSVEGVPVKEVALMFRDVDEVELEFEPQAYDHLQVVPSALRPPTTALIGTISSGFSSNSNSSNSSNLTFHQSPLLHRPQVVLHAPPVAAKVAPTGSRAVLSPGSALGVPTSPTTFPSRAAAAPMLPELHRPSRDPSQRAEQAPELPCVVNTVQTSTAASLSNESVSAPASSRSLAKLASEIPEPEIIRPTPVIAAHRAVAVSEPSLPQASRLAQVDPAPKTVSASPPAPSPTRTSNSIQSPAPTQSSKPTPAPTPTTMPSQASDDDHSARNGVSLPSVLQSALHETKPVAPSPKRARPSLPSSAETTSSPVTANTPVKRITPSSTSSPASRTSGKKRTRPTASDATSSSDDSSVSSTQRGRVTPRNQSTVPDDSDGGTSSRYPEQQSLRHSRRRRGSGEGTSRRPRVNLTVERLERMGFTREDANASVTACGHNLDACMVWIVSHLEEKQFLNDLNQASIQSELSKRAEEQGQKKQEHETMMKAKEFTALFTTSYMLSDESTATQFKEMLSGAIGDVHPDSFLRVVLTKLLKLEAQAIKWYKAACRCYLLQLAERLEACFGSHDVATCCSKLKSSDGGAAVAAGRGCAFVRLLHEEERSLSKALFDMPENQGGVPLVFLKADKDMQFSLDDDGFEVLEVEVEVEVDGE